MTKKLEATLNQLEYYMKDADRLNTSISDGSIGWHIEHTLLTVRSIILALKNSKQENYSWKPSIPRFFVFTMKKIPRGKAKAPSHVQPKAIPEVEHLKKHLVDTLRKLSDIESIHPKQYMEHPIFGKLDLKSTIRFLEIHSKHHLKIIEDIRK